MTRDVIEAGGPRDLSGAATAIRPGVAVPAAADQRRGQAREALLQAAWVTLARDGYEKITTRRIAEIAGVNIATLHYHFGTKELLLSEATRFALRSTEARLRAAFEGAESAVVALDRVFAAIWQMVAEGNGVLRYDLLVRGFRDAGARADVLQIYARYRALTEDLVAWRIREGGRLAAGRTAAGVAHYMLCSIDGVILQHVLTGDDDSAREALDMIRQHVLMLLDEPVPVGSDR